MPSRIAFGALVKTDAEKWWPIVEEFGVKAGVNLDGCSL
jgi:hypothetical protein